MFFKILTALVPLLSIALFYANNRFYTMPSLSVVKTSNAAFKTSLKNPVAVFTGGTNGIGGALAVKLAQYSTSPEIHIVGRSQAGADKVIKEMKSVNPEGRYTFHKADLSLISSTSELTSSLRASLGESRITHLVLSQGILTTAGRTETKEGNDIKMMLHYYSRMLVIRELTPLFSSEGARVMSVLDSLRANKKKLLWNDLELKKGFSLSNAANHCMTMNDVALQHLAVANPSSTFIHAYPSMVATELFRGMPGYIQPFGSALSYLFATSAPDCAEWLFSSLHRKSTPGVPLFVDNRDGDASGKTLASAEEMEKIWTHTSELLDRSK